MFTGLEALAPQVGEAADWHVGPLAVPGTALVSCRAAVAAACADAQQQMGTVFLSGWMRCLYLGAL